VISAMNPNAITITLLIDGSSKTLTCLPGDTLLRVMRGEGIWSVRFGSNSGETGAAALLLDGQLVSSDVILAAQADGHVITTTNWFNLNSADDELHPIQAAFVATGAMQSGYSVGAMMLGAKALIESNPNPSEFDIRDMLSGILDRETAYVKPVEAIKRAAALLRGEAVEPFRPEILSLLTDGKNNPVEVSGDLKPIAASPAVPRVIPSREVPDMAVVGKPEIKVDAVKLVKGYSAFADDIEMRGMLTAKVLRSPHAHANILDIDDAAAQALPGVHAVLHYKNTARIKYASGGQSWPNPFPWDQVSFDNVVRHVGDRVAVVAAETEEIAIAALKLLKVTYEILGFNLDERIAENPSTPKVHAETDSPGQEPEHNLVHHLAGATVKDIDAAFAGSPHLFEQTFRVHQVQQCPIEPHIAVAWLDEDDRVVIRTSTQVPFHVRRMVAPLLGKAVRDVRIIKPRIGGGFGAKQEMLIEDIVGLLTLATKRPVRLELDREEEFASSRTRHPQTITYKTGVDNDGKLTAQEMRVIGNTGPYGTHGFTVQMVTGLRGLSSYNAPAKHFDCRVVYTNIPVPGAYRGYGAPQAEFALESHMEDIASALSIDAMDFKRKNWVKIGDPMDIAPRLGERGGVEDIADEDLPRIYTSGIEECVAQGKRAIGWHRRYDPSWTTPVDRPNIRRGLGFAFCMHGTAIPFLDMGGCSIKINDDGSFNVAAGAADLGTGADTVLAQIAAEVLGVSMNDIVMYSGDTDHTPFDVGAYASSTTYISGMAVKKAADEIRWKLKKRAAKMLDVDQPCSIELHDKRAWSADGRSVSLEEIALDTLHTQDQEQLMGTASHVSTECPPPFAAQFAEIEVDIQTGQVTVIKLVMAVDCGVAINPVTASGQVEGGMIQALGYAHCEEFAFDDTGRMINTSFGPYKIYRADEVPDIEVFLVQTMEDSGPFGAKAVAEIPKDGVAPALRAAIKHATGVAINEIPFTPERVWNALQAR
jgi:putative selenate reductase molybdopterin-binding subunit